MISAYEAASGARFVWRGVANADRPLHSSLVRLYKRRHGGQMPREAQLRDFERDVIAEAREWGLEWRSLGGHLNGLELLATLQHYEIPTRLLDFTFNPLIALWFAVEKHDQMDGRVFAIDISDRQISREAASRPDPWWWDDFPPHTGTPWTTESWVWRPPPLEPRIVRQEGCFLVGGVPSTERARNVRIAHGWRLIHADEVRECMSVPFRLISYDQAVAAFNGQALVGHAPRARAFTLRIQNKPQLRTELDRAFSYSHSSLFPDFAGFKAYGRSVRA